MPGVCASGTVVVLPGAALCRNLMIVATNLSIQEIVRGREKIGAALAYNGYGTQNESRKP